MYKQGVLWLFKIVVVTYVLPLSITQSSTNQSWRISYTKSSGEVVSFTPNELLEALTNPKKPSRKEFETEEDFKNRMTNWKKDIEKMKTGKYDVQIPSTSIELDSYDMDRKGFPFKIKACRLSYTTRTDTSDHLNPIIMYNISTIYVSTVGLFMRDGFVDIGGFLPIDIKEAKEMRARKKEVTVLISDLLVETGTKTASFCHPSTSDKRYANIVSDLLRPWFYVDLWEEKQYARCRVRETCIKAIEPESDGMGFNVPGKKPKKVHKLKFILGERSWSTNEWRSLPDK